MIGSIAVLLVMYLIWRFRRQALISVLVFIALVIYDLVHRESRRLNSMLSRRLERVYNPRMEK